MWQSWIVWKKNFASKIGKMDKKLTVCYYHVTYEFQRESTLYSLPEWTPCLKQVPYLKLNLKWLRQDSNPQPPSLMASLEKLLDVSLWTKWLWIWILLQSLDQILAKNKVLLKNLLKNLVINFYWICSMMKVYNIYGVPTQMPCLGIYFFLRYGPKCSHPIR